MDVREGLHRMLASSSLSTKGCLQMCVESLLDNLKKYPQVCDCNITITPTWKSQVDLKIIINILDNVIFLLLNTLLIKSNVCWFWKYVSESIKTFMIKLVLCMKNSFDNFWCWNKCSEAYCLFLVCTVPRWMLWHTLVHSFLRTRSLEYKRRKMKGCSKSHYVFSYLRMELGWQHILAIMLKDKEKQYLWLILTLSLSAGKVFIQLTQSWLCASGKWSTTYFLKR